jgi:hypothetical protein
VGYLYARDGPEGLDRPRDFPQGLGMTVVPDAEVAGRDSAFGEDGGGLDYDEARSADGALGVMAQVPIARETVKARILAHRRKGDTVRQLDAAKPQGFEKKIGHVILRPRY